MFSHVLTYSKKNSKCSSKTKMNPTSDQALRTALDHETTSIVRQLQADNERLRNELATANANLANPYLRAVLSLIDKHRFQHRDMGAGSLEVMLIEFYRFPLEEKLAIIPMLCGLGYWVMHETNMDHIDRGCPFTVHWNHTEEKLRMDYYDFFTRGGILHRPTE